MTTSPLYLGGNGDPYVYFNKEGIIVCAIQKVVIWNGKLEHGQAWVAKASIEKKPKKEDTKLEDNSTKSDKWSDIGIEDSY